MSLSLLFHDNLKEEVQIIIPLGNAGLSSLCLKISQICLIRSFAPKIAQANVDFWRKNSKLALKKIVASFACNVIK